MGSFEIPLCFYCKHKTKGRLKCKAFEDELIPEEIILGAVDHIQPHPEQKNEIVFESSTLFKEAIRSKKRKETSGSARSAEANF
jgi:hypothetical protein